MRRRRLVVRGGHTAAATVFEVGLYGLLARTVPGRVLGPLAAGPARGGSSPPRRRPGARRAHERRSAGRWPGRRARAVRPAPARARAGGRGDARRRRRGHAPRGDAGALRRRAGRQNVRRREGAAGCGGRSTAALRRGSGAAAAPRPATGDLSTAWVLNSPTAARTQPIGPLLDAAVAVRRGSRRRRGPRRAAARTAPERWRAH